jgi:hypothetical protein
MQGMGIVSWLLSGNSFLIDSEPSTAFAPYSLADPLQN